MHEKAVKSPFMIQSCPTCDGNGVSGGSTCPSCAGVGVWAVHRGYVLYYQLPLGIDFSFSYLVNRWLGRLVGLFCCFWAVLGSAGLIRNITVRIENAHDYWFDFTSMGWWGIAAYSGLLLLLGFAYWFTEGRYPRARKFTALPDQPEISTAISSNWQTLTEQLETDRFVDLTSHISYKTRASLNNSIERARKNRRREYAAELIMAELCSNGWATTMGLRLNLDTSEVARHFLEKSAQDEMRDDERLIIARDIKKVLLFAYDEASMLQHDDIRRRTVFLGCLRARDSIRDYFRDTGVHLDELRSVVYWLDMQDIQNEWWRRVHVDHFRSSGKQDKGWMGGWTLSLDKHSRDLTTAARKGFLRNAVGREREIDEVDRILSRSSKSNVILIGEPGVGKTAIVEGLAHRIVAGKAADALKDKRLVALNIASVVGSGGSVGQFGDIMGQIIKESLKAKNVILVIQNIHELKGAGSADGGGLDAFGILQPALTRDDFQCIGTTSFREYKRFVETNEAFARCFEKVEVPEPDSAATMKILQDVVLRFEKKHKVMYSYQALLTSVKLSVKYIHDKVLPDKAIDLLDEAGVMCSHKRGHKIVNARDVADVVASKTNIPINDVTTDESSRLLDLEQAFHRRLVGQEEAVSAVSEAIRRARVGLKDAHRPIATFLFVGPTGVGKTELAKTLAEVYFGHEKIMVRLDMSEYQDASSISRLIGAAPGLAGSDAGGQLTEAVRKRPFALLLLDEFEKAHSDVHNVFLQVFDDGRLTDSSGRVIDFTNTIIIATSNAGAKMIQDGILQNRKIEDIRVDMMKNILPSIFKPELINRFDGVILFKPLTLENVNQIAARMLAKIRDQLVAQDIEFKITSEAVAKISQIGFDPVYGARPLKRAIQDKIENPIAGKILRGEINKGETLVIREIDL